MSANLENSAVATGWKRSVFIPIPKKGNAKNVQTTIQLYSFHMLVRLCSKCFKLGFSSVWIENFQMYKLDLEKAEEPETKLPTSTVSSKKQEFQKKIYFCFTDYAMHLTVCITTNCGKFSMRWEYQTTLPVSWETCIQDKQQQLELDMEQRTGSKLGKEYIKAVYCQPAYLTYMHSTSCKMPSWIKNKLESRLLGKYQ